MDYGNVDIVGRVRVKLLANAAAEAAYTPPDGSLAYRVDLAQARLRAAGAWVPFSSLPTGYERGAALSWTSVKQVSVAKGRVRDLSDSFDITIPAALTADITVVGVNGLDMGVEAANTWYAVYVIADMTGANPVASLLSTSFAVPALPAGYDKFRRVGCVRNGAAGDFLKFYQVWNGTTRRYWYDESRVILSVLAGGVSPVFVDVPLAALVPPTSRSVVLFAELVSVAAGGIILRPDGSAETATTWQLTLGAPGLGSGAAQIEMPCSVAQIIEYEVSAGSADLDVAGFDDEV